MKKKSIPKFVAGLLALGLGMATPAAHGSDSFNFCGGYDQEPNSIVDLPEDNAMHFDPELGYAEYEQFYWNGILRTPGGKRYAYFLIIYQFTVGDYPFQFPVRAAAGAIQDLQTKVMYKDSYFDFSSGQAYPLPTQTGSFDFELSNPDPNSNFHIKATGKNGVDKLEMTFTDGSNLSLIVDNVKNPQTNFHNGFMRYCDATLNPECDPFTPSPDGVFGHGLNFGEPGYHGEHYYYSRPRMAAAGKVQVPGGPKRVVVGDSWFDREFGTFIQDLQWVWFSIRLDTGEEINVYDIRNYPQPTISEETWMTGEPIVQSATFQGAPTSCERVELFGNSAPDGGNGGVGDFELTFSGGEYGSSRTFLWPTQYTFSVPSRDLDLDITPEFMDQEFFIVGVFTPYWIGIANVTGTRDGEPVTGHAYIEAATKCCNGDDGDDLPPVHP